MLRTIINRIARDQQYPDRVFTLDVLERVREGALYDHLPSGFHEEKKDNGEYIPLRDRRPSVQHNICRIVVEDSISMLFSEGHFPTPEIESDNAARDNLLQLSKTCRLNEIMIAAATIGSIGSVAIVMRSLKQADGSYLLFFESYDTRYLTPEYNPAAPEELLRITEKYKVKGSDLRRLGYAIDDDSMLATWWFQRQWDANAEIWYLPWKPADEAEPGFAPKIDAEKTVSHELAFCPWVWIRNLPGRLRLLQYDGAPVYSDIDGACTFQAAIDTMIEIDYLLSQSGRGLKYAMDPTLVVKEPPAQADGFVKSPANALILDVDGDAKLLETNGSAFRVVLEWVKALREFALESIHGNRADAQKMSAAMSGRAMQMMNHALVLLADRLRISYGEHGYKRLLHMAILAHARYPVTVNGQTLPPIDPALPITLNWPSWYAKTGAELSEEAQMLKTLRDGKIVSKKTAVANVAFDLDIEDVDAELAQIDADQKADIALIPDSAHVQEQIRVSE